MDIGTCDLNLRRGVSFSIIRVSHLPHKTRPVLPHVPSYHYSHPLLIGWTVSPIARYLVRLESLIRDTREGFVIVCLRYLVLDQGDRTPMEIDSSVRGHGR
jgi:hypothetical protein